MSDDIDRANDLAELERTQAVYNAMQVTGNERLTGWCQNDCGTSTQGAYCSAECRRDATMRERMR